eukprot:447880-Hanusia_phi.AAC.3
MMRSALFAPPPPRLLARSIATHSTFAALPAMSCNCQALLPQRSEVNACCGGAGAELMPGGQRTNRSYDRCIPAAQVTDPCRCSTSQALSAVHTKAPMKL